MVLKASLLMEFTYSERVENHIGVLVDESFLNSCQTVPSPMSMQNGFISQPGFDFVLHGSVDATLSVSRFSSAVNDLRVVSCAVDLFADSKDGVPIL